MRTRWTVVAVTAVALAAVSSLLVRSLSSPTESVTLPGPTREASFGAFLGSDASGVERIPGFEEWLGGREMTVGHTYLPPNSWADVRGPDFVLRPWTGWVAADPERMLVLNVPMLVPNEVDVGDIQNTADMQNTADIQNTTVSTLLRFGAAGMFDRNFEVLAERLVSSGAPETVIVLGWEMNGATYTSRCEPNPEAWKQYWRSIVETMRSVPGQRFRFDFTPSRGMDAIPWTTCYPGDDVVDIIGMDSYDQPPDDDFDDYVDQPLGLRQQAEFAAARAKPISFAEWGLFRYGDRPEYIRQMYEWIRTHDVLYHTISDYCPHGVWQCDENPESSAVFRELLGVTPEGAPGDKPGG